MSKETYLDLLRQKLLENNIPGADQMVDFYAEMIEDRVEDGMTPEEAVASMVRRIDADEQLAPEQKQMLQDAMTRALR